MDCDANFKTFKFKIMYKYEIRYFGSHEMNEIIMQKYLNEKGKDRWEFVQVIEKQALNDPSSIANYRFFFKRLIQN